MKHIFTTTLFCFLFITQVCGQTDSKEQYQNKTHILYVNEIYRFNVAVPISWKLYGEIKNDTTNHRAIVDWGLPQIYSELEEVEIENSISIIAYQKPEINSVEDVIQLEYLKTNPTETILEIDETNPNVGMIYTSTLSGLKYQGKSYYVFKDGIGYVITFMATPGTYNKNIKVFEEFYNDVTFLGPPKSDY